MSQRAGRKYVPLPPPGKPQGRGLETIEAKLKNSWQRSGRNSSKQKLAKRKHHPVWKPQHLVSRTALRSGLNRSEASIVTQLRTRNIGLREYLATQKVPRITPECGCGFPKETIPHFLLFCAQRKGRANMILQAGSRDLDTLLCEKQPIQAAARWIFREGLLPQFSYAKKTLERKGQTANWLPIADLDIGQQPRLAACPVSP